ncbi:IS3 family transposase [Gemmatimonas sp.]|uniref:IS3 family transposase n=1 Tax=Gemmatimonas sp. TaxID=1962908 RepID=UPI0037BF8FC0
MDAHCTQFRVTWLCHRFDVTPSGFYAWRTRGVSDHATQDRRLTTEIVRLFARHYERYGSPRLHRALVDAGWTVSRRRVARLMAAAGLRAKAVRGYRAKAAVHQRYARHPNLLWRTTVTATNQVWVGDITYFKVAGCWWYLAIVMDQFSRRILAWSLTRRRTSAVTCAVLAEAVRRRPAEGVIFHSDRGTEYMGAAFGDALVAHGMRQSASVRGPGDNAHAESFWHSLKAELTRGVTFLTDHALRTALRQYIRYYNRTRLHSSLNYTSPIAFERRAA